MNNRLIVSPENEQTALTVVSKDTQQYLSVSTEHDVSVVSDREQRADIQPSKDTALLMVPVQTVKQDLVTKTDCIVYVPLATKNSYGIIKPGEGLTIKDGVLSVIYAGEGGGVTATYVQNSIHEHNMDEMAHPYLQEKILEIEAISKGRAKALAYLTYSDMVFAVNNFLPEEYSIGQSIYIGTKNVPDLWIYGIEDDFEEYAYISDESIVDVLNEHGYIKIGYYLLSPLETGKTVVGNYVTLDTIQTVSGIKTFTEKIGLLNSAEGEADFIKHINNNFLITSHDGKSLLNIDEQLEKIYSFNKELANKEFIKNSYLSFTESQTLTEDQKALVRSKIGAGSGSFSGAFNDLSGIPILSTNNNSSLIVGEETIKNTIKLHKVSKTGLLRDLIEDASYRTVTDTEKASWNAKASNVDFLKLEGDVDNISSKVIVLESGYNDLYTKHNEQDTSIKNLSDNKADKTITINGKDLSTDVVLTNIDVGALSEDTKYASGLSVSINTNTYVVTIQLKDQEGNNIGLPQTIDLPLESVVVGGEYDETDKEVVLTLKDGSKISFSVADLIVGLASQSSLDDTNSKVTALTTKTASIENKNNQQDTDILNLTNNKVDKIEGKQLSTNDYTTVEKNKLKGISEGAEVNVQSDWNNTDNTSDAFIKNKPNALSAFINDIDAATNAYVNSEISKLDDKILTKADQSTVSAVGDTVSTLEINYRNLNDTKADKTELLDIISRANKYTDEEILALRGTSAKEVTLSSLANDIEKTSEDISALNTHLDNEINSLNTELANKVDKEAGKGLSTYDFDNEYKGKIDSTVENINDVNQKLLNIQNNKADKTEIPDVSSFITNTADNLINYYIKSDTYNKQEVNNLIGSITSISFEVVNALPTIGSANIIYLIPKTSNTNDIYEEFIYVNNSWEKIGDTSVDLSNYYNKTEVDTKLSGKLDLTGGTVTYLYLNNELRIAQGTNRGIKYAAQGNVVEVSSTTTNNAHTITVGNPNDYLKLVGKLPTINGSTIATLTDVSDAVNSGNLTIKRNGTEVGSFNANNISDVEVDIIVPTKTSDLTNDSGFITSSDIPTIPTKTSQLTNDSGFITADEVPDTAVLYGSTGQNTDGAMTQKATTDELNKKVEFEDVDEIGGIDYAAGLQTQINNKAAINANNISGDNLASWKNKLGVEYATYSGSTINTEYGSFKIHKYGRVCILTVWDAKMNRNMGTYAGLTIIENIPSPFIPITQMVTEFGAEGNGAQSLAYINTDGTAHIGSWGTNINSGKHLTFQIVYISQE